MSALDESLRILVADVHAWREAKHKVVEPDARDAAVLRSARLEVWSAYARLGDALRAEMGIETICRSAWEHHERNIPAALEDVAEVIAEDSISTEGYSQEEIVGIFRLKDGRFLYVSGGCDTTGWDCQSGASGEIRDTLDAIIVECCTEDERKRLGLALPGSR